MTDLLLELRRIADELKDWSEDVAQHNRDTDHESRVSAENISIGLQWAEDHVRDRIDQLELGVFQ